MLIPDIVCESNVTKKLQNRYKSTISVGRTGLFMETFRIEIFCAISYNEYIIKESGWLPMDLQVSDDVSKEFLAEVMPILENEEFLSLGAFCHHQWTNRLMHSINVSYVSWHIARKLGCDAGSAARAGLLHDFCPYDFKKRTPTGEHQAFYHPKAAAKNSERVFQISEREQKAILSHMFPLGPMPRNSEAWIITLADKICASMELCHVAIALARGNKMVLSTTSA